MQDVKKTMILNVLIGCVPGIIQAIRGVDCILFWAKRNCAEDSNKIDNGAGAPPLGKKAAAIGTLHSRKWANEGGHD